MNFEITIKHNISNIHKANEIMDNINMMAKKRDIDLVEELEIKLVLSEEDTIFIIPNITFEHGELYKGKSEEFTKDYLETYATAEGIVVDFGKISTLN